MVSGALQSVCGKGFSSENRVSDWLLVLSPASHQQQQQQQHVLQQSLSEDSLQDEPLYVR